MTFEGLRGFGAEGFNNLKQTLLGNIIDFHSSPIHKIPCKVYKKTLCLTN